MPFALLVAGPLWRYVMTEEQKDLRKEGVELVQHTMLDDTYVKLRDAEKLRSAPMGDFKVHKRAARAKAEKEDRLDKARRLAGWASEEALEKRITGNRKVIYPAKLDTEMGLGYGLANDDSEPHVNEKPSCFRHACFRDKFPSEQERQEAIDKFIADVGDYGDTILWRAKPKLWGERSFEHDKIEYWAYFRFSVWYLPKEQI